MSRAEFPAKVRKQAFERANGFCECGCGLPFGKSPKERPVYDHETPDFLGGTNDLDNCKCIRLDHHERKTATEDMPKIVKVRREDKRRNGTGANKSRLPFGRGDSRKKKLNGEVVER